MPTVLSELVINEVSLVDRPANPYARLVLMKAKAAKPKGVDMSIIQKALALLSSKGNTVEAALAGDELRAGVSKGLADALAAEPDAAKRTVLISKTVAEVMDGIVKAFPPKDEDEDEDEMNMENKAKKAKKSADGLSDTDHQAIAKATESLITKALEPLKAENAALKGKVEKAEQDAALKDLTARFEKSGVPNAADVAKSMASVDEATIKTVEASFLALNARAAQADILTKAMGSAAPVSDGSARAIVAGKVEVLQKAVPTMTEFAARASIFKNDAALRDKYNAEMRPASR